MTCKHAHSTLTRAYLDDGTPLSIHQCDMCGLSLPRREVAAVDIWTLPEFDAAAADRGWEWIFRELFEIAEKKIQRAVNLVRGAKSGKQRTDIR
ncbi:MAG TPA: hypothetical protein VKA67_08965 [Verrucomicrobiae bacterium]|nr:hypothetical protein [Verrucomicrobiae bacterium]